MKKVLIAYYSKTATSKRVCEIIKETLEKNDIEVHVLLFEEVRHIKEYDQVIMAAPINAMSWVGAGKNFLDKFQSDLREKETIILYISYILKCGNKFWKKRMLQSMEKIGKAIDVNMIHGFGGVIQEGFPAFARLIFGIKKDTPLDLSNDQEVIRFAEELL